MSAPECCKKINNKNFLKSAVIIFIAIFATDFLIHGVLLKGSYQETATLWRPEAEMQSYFGWMLAGQALIALTFTRLFAHGYQNKGILEGICFGMMTSLLFIANNFIMYSVSPWPIHLLGLWSVCGFVQSIVLGAIVAKTYKD